PHKAATIHVGHCSCHSGRGSVATESRNRQSLRYIGAPPRDGYEMTVEGTMLDVSADARRPALAGPPLDFQAHLAALAAQGLLVRVERPINKDTELHPLVRWQFQGGLAEDARRAFLFTNVVDGSGRRFDIPVAVGALAASPRIYAVGMGRPVEEIEAAWTR